FLPASLVELRRVRDLAPYVGRNLDAKIIELDKNRNNVVLSRRAWLEETQREQREEFLVNLKPGESRRGVVSSVVNFGAFVDLGGMDGLVHVSELSWKHVDHPSSVVSVGDEIEVQVLDVDLDKERISLSLKATQQDPWQEFATTHRVGELVYGRVTKLVPFGAFVQVGEGIEGLVHISELAERHVEVPDQVVQVGDEVTVEVLDVDMDRERVSLSLKATQEDPWRHFARTHAIGQIVPGKVTKLVPFGAFVRVEEGIEGLVHISELAERHVEVPDQVVAVGDDAMVKVIDIDLERRRISLSLKQANEDYTEEFDPSKYGMADSYDEQGNYIFPEGFDSETNEWLEGYDKQRGEWESRYAEAERRHKMHTAQMEKFAAAEAAAAETQPSANGAQRSEENQGSLASDAQLAALREKLAGSA
ncbi:MAG: S1 RNA-binding domain-containing protein, partial [Mycobacteriaceae bacterium]|nr:S1 RNA-binding domain-containing protein [Mycobacteriaceae bacterium]